MSRRELSAFIIVCGLLALGATAVLADHDPGVHQQQQPLAKAPPPTHHGPKAERSESTSTYFLHDVDNKARFGVAGWGGSGLTILLPILLVLGLFVIIIPIFGLLFTTGLGLAGGFGGAGYGGAAVPGGLYPAASAAGRKWVGGESPLLSQENVIKMVSFVDKALQDFGKQFKNKQR
ncbi:uncharacterized protein LOC144168574 [Haemaphysalis longicornis]